MDRPVRGKLLSSGSEAEVFEFGAAVVKLYRKATSKRSAFREAGTLALVESLGLPAPAVSGIQLFDGRWGMIMARAPGRPFAEAMQRQPGLIPAYLKAMAALQLRIHSHPGTYLGTAKSVLAATIRRVNILNGEQQSALLAGLSALPDGDRLCHGDYHPFNILGTPGDEMLIDWPDANQGSPATDVCRSYVLMKAVMPELASDYVDAYVSASGVSRNEIFAWLPFVAAARLVDCRPDEVDDLLKLADRER